jgi:L-ribulose-5-phosphate 4-epimerase
MQEAVMEGVIQFTISERQITGPIELPAVERLNRLRQYFYDLHLIGYNSVEGLGYGNVSVRLPGGACLISGSQTGHLPELTGEHFCVITGFDFEANSVSCRGPLNPSSESLSHSAIYTSAEHLTTVVHFHSAEIWKILYESDTVLHTSPEATCGSIQLSREIAAFVSGSSSTNGLVIVMEGHRDGIIIAAESEEGIYRLFHSIKT